MTPFRFLLPVLLVTATVVGCNGDETQPPPDLEAPTGVAVEATSPNTARVTWNAVSGAISYTIERAQGAGGNFETVGNSATTTFDDSGLNPDTQYRYRVAAVSGNAQSDFSSEATVTTPPAIIPTIGVTADITTNTTWTSSNVYLLKGFIHVANGATLTIEAGTKIVGDFNTLGASLFVLRGARIMAEGTAQAPIVFTSSREEGQRQAGDWGGLILIGNGIINRSSPVFLEGSGTDPLTNPALDYSGGTNNADDSGALSYVRVEFAGYAPAEDAELNTFTLAAVGSGTRCDHLQSLNGLDDSYEFFGGAIDCQYLVSYNSGDDHFDMSEGYVGRIQFAIAFQTRTVVPRPLAGNISSDPQGIENDGCAGSNCLNGQDSQPYNLPMVANFTLVGPPASVTNSSGNIGMMLRRGTAGVYLNGVVARWGRAGISLRDQTTLDRIADGNLILRNILVAESPVIFQPQTGTTVQGSVDLVVNEIQDALGTAASSLFTLVPTTEPANGAALDFEPPTGSAAASGGLMAFTGSIADKAGTVVVPTAYRGAVGAGGQKWWQGWTYFATN